MFVSVYVSLFVSVCPKPWLQSHQEAAATRKLMDQFNEFCSALHATKQTHTVKKRLTTKGMCIF